MFHMIGYWVWVFFGYLPWTQDDGERNKTVLVYWRFWSETWIFNEGLKFWYLHIMQLLAVSAVAHKVSIHGSDGTTGSVTFIWSKGACRILKLKSILL